MKKKSPYDCFSDQELDTLENDTFQVEEDDWISVFPDRIILSSKNKEHKRRFLIFDKVRFNKLVDWYKEKQ